MTAEHGKRKGSFGYRFLITTLNILLAVLFYWLLGFVLDDISDQPGPDWTTIQTSYQDKALVAQNKSLNEQLLNLNRTIDSLKQQQSLTQSSISSYRDTMNQLLSLQKSSVQKGVNISADAQQNLTKVTQEYLDNQQRYQKLNTTLADKYNAAQDIQSQINSNNTKLDAQSTEANKEYQKQMARYNLKIAALQLCFLLPLLVLVTYLYRRFRQTIYVSMFIAVGIATLIEIALVMHEHFPSRYFKYILILALIFLVIWALKAMLRMIVKPQSKWLQKQNRDAYQKMLCAICQYPITPGLLKLTLPVRKQKEMQLANLDYLTKIDDYICPSCGEKLFEKCEQCHEIRHSLLSFCDHCGFEKKI